MSPTHFFALFQNICKTHPHILFSVILKSHTTLTLPLSLYSLKIFALLFLRNTNINLNLISLLTIHSKFIELLNYLHKTLFKQKKSSLLSYKKHHLIIILLIS